MAIISTSDLQTVLDKMARFANEAVSGYASAAANVFPGGSGLAAFVLALNEEDQVADLLPAARDLDQTPPTPASTFLTSHAEVLAMLNALDTHVKRFGYASLDARLTSLNASTPTLRAHEVFRTYYPGRVTAGNLFTGSDVTLARIVTTGAAAGTFTSLATLDKTKVSGAKLVAKNQGVIGSTTGITVTGVKFDGTTSSLTASISTLTDAFETDLSSTLKLFYSVSAIAVTGATASNTINIVAKADRSVASA